MATQIFINLPVEDLNKSIAFFTRLGFTFNPQFTDATGTCMIISDTIFVMLLTKEKFKLFIKKPIADAHANTEVILCLSAESREKVDEMVNKAIEAGGKAPFDKQDHGFMYGWGFVDPDGHHWEVAWMDLSAVPQG